MTEKLSWEEICKRYPEQWLGLTDVEWKDKKNWVVDSAIVSIIGETFNTLAKRFLKYENFEIMYTFPEIVFDNSLECNYERLTHNEIIEKYPSQWIGMTQVIREDDNVNIESAIVLYSDKTMKELTHMQMLTKGALWSEYTTPDDGSFMSLGML